MIDYTKIAKEDLYGVLLEAASHGILKMVKKMIKVGVDPKNEIFWSQEIQGSDPLDFNSLALLHAARNGHLDVVKYLRPLSDNDLGALKGAIFHGHLDIVKYLIVFIDYDNRNYNDFLSYSYLHKDVNDFLEEKEKEYERMLDDIKVHQASSQQW